MLVVLEEMRCAVNNTQSNKRGNSVSLHIANLHVQTFKRIFRDFIVITCTSKSRIKMYTSRVKRLMTAKMLSKYTVEVEHILSRQLLVVHALRVRENASSNVVTVTAMREVAERTNQVWLSVEAVKQVRSRSSIFKVIASWESLTASGNTLQLLYNVAFCFRKCVQSQWSSHVLQSVACFKELLYFSVNYIFDTLLSSYP